MPTHNGSTRRKGKKRVRRALSDEEKKKYAARPYVSIHARFPGVCRRCGTAFGAGTVIRYGGFGRTYHLGSRCPASERLQEEASRPYAPPASTSTGTFMALFGG